MISATDEPSAVEGPLHGLVVGITADRRAEEQAELLLRRGAKVVHGPMVRTLPLTDGDELSLATDACISEPPDVVVLSTALGIRAWSEAAESRGVGDGLGEALRGARILARGPKASGAALTAGWDVDWVSPLASAADMVRELAEMGVTGRRVAVQLDGRAEPVLADAVRALGADVVAVPVYRWELPRDPTPARRLIEATIQGTIDAVTFTSSPAVWNTEHLATAAGLGDEFRERLSSSVTAVCVGPVCAAAADAAGYTNIVQPARARLGSMVKALVAHVGAHRAVLVLGATEIEVRATAVVVDGELVELTPRERDVFAVLARRPGAVVTKGQLLAEVWRGGADGHAVEVTVGRLRRRLGSAVPIRTVPRRGYRLDLGPLTASPAGRARGVTDT